MSKQHEANSTYEHGIEAGFSRKQIINEIMIEVGVSAGYASTLYNNAKKATQPARHSAERHAQTKPSTKSFGKATCKALRVDLDAAIKAVMKKHGITHKIGKMTYNADEITTRLTISNAADQEVVANNQFNIHCSSYGLKPTDLNRQFNINGRVFTITGIKPNRRKYPITGTGVQGGRYKFTAEQVTRNLV